MERLKGMVYVVYVFGLWTERSRIATSCQPSQQLDHYVQSEFIWNWNLSELDFRFSIQWLHIEG
jgi:hypothetical protein